MALKIHHTAIIENGAQLHDNVTVGEYSIIRSGVSLGEGSVVGAFCEIGHNASSEAGSTPLTFGKNSTIRSHSVFYTGSVFGDNLTTGHNVCVRSGTTAGESLSLGTGTDIQGDCVIGNFVRMHSNVHVSMKSAVESYVWIFPGVVLTNDPRPPSEDLVGVRVEEFAILAVGVTVLPGKTVGRGSLIAAGSVLTRDAEPESLYSGNPANNLGPLTNLRLSKDGSAPAYPWRHRFHRGYPDDVVKGWISELSD
jgi:acetyltransferase-like isoleucine patch superfamily enzyme